MWQEQLIYSHMNANYVITTDSRKHRPSTHIKTILANNTKIEMSHKFLSDLGIPLSSFLSPPPPPVSLFLSVLEEFMFGLIKIHLLLTK